MILKMWMRRMKSAGAAASIGLCLAACAVDDDADDVVVDETTSALAGSRADAVATTLEFQGVVGNWGQQLFCESGSFVRGFSLKVERGQHDGDDTALNAVSLRCWKPDGTFVENLENEQGPYGRWSPDWVNCPGKDNFVKGARMRIEDQQGIGDDTGANDLEFACRNGGTISQTNGMGWGEWSAWKFCPANTFVCGSQVKLDPPQGHGDDKSLNGIRLRCCSL